MGPAADDMDLSVVAVVLGLGWDDTNDEGLPALTGDYERDQQAVIAARMRAARERQQREAGE